MHAAENWFLDNGVPHFLQRYSAADRWPRLAAPLIALVAFEVGLQPWTAPTLLQLLTAPPLLLGLVVFVRWHYKTYEAKVSPNRPWYVLRLASWAIRGVVLGLAFGIALGIYLDWMGIELGLTDVWVDGLIILLVLAASAALLRPGTRMLETGTARRLLWFSLGAVVLFAAEGTVIPRFRDMWQSLVPIGLSFRPQALPALLVVVPLAYACWRVSRAPTDVQSGPTAGAVTVAPAVPLLLILLGAETATFPHTEINEWLVATSVIICSGLSVLFGILRARRPAEGQRRARQWRTAGVAVVGTSLIIFLLGYPLVVSFYGYINVASIHVEGIRAFLVAASVNAAYLIVTLFVVSFGLDRLAVWAMREARENRRNLGSGLAEGLPLLLVFVTFFTFSQETWQIAHLASPVAFGALLVVLVLAVVLVVLWTAKSRVGTHPQFETTEIRKLATDAAAGDDALSPLVGWWWEQTGPEKAALEFRLKGKTRINAVAVLAMYEALVLVPLTCLAAAVLFFICKLTVQPPVAAGWIYGDGQESKGDAWKDDLFAQPWVRVAVVLAVFALLYVAVEVHRDDATSSRFFAGASIAMDRRLAMYVIYYFKLSCLVQTNEDAATTPLALPSQSVRQQQSEKDAARLESKGSSTDD